MLRKLLTKRRKPAQVKLTKPKSSNEENLFARAATDCHYEESLSTLLTAKDIVSLSSTCTLFNNLLNSEITWKKRYQADFGFIHFEEDYKAQYIIQGLFEREQQLYIDCYNGGEKIIHEKLKAIRMQINKYLQRYKEKKWTAYYFSLLHREQLLKNKKYRDIALKAILAGDVRIVFHLAFAFRYGDESSEKFSAELYDLFNLLSALVNRGQPVSPGQHSLLHKRLIEIINDKENKERGRYIEFMKALTFVYIVLADMDSGYFAGARDFYCTIANVYMNNVNEFINFTDEFMGLIDDRAYYDLELLREFQKQNPSENSIELAGKFHQEQYVFPLGMLTSYLEKNADTHPTAAYFYANDLALFDYPNLENAVHYYFKALEGKEYRAAQALYDLVNEFGNSKLIDENKLKQILREGVSQGDKTCMDILVNACLKDKQWAEDPYNIWLLQKDAELEKRANSEEIAEWLIDSIIEDEQLESSWEALEEEGKRQSKDSYVGCAIALVEALNGVGQSNDKLRFIIENHGATLCAYLDIGKAQGFDIEPAVAVIKRVEAEIEKEAEWVSISSLRLR